MSALGPAVLLDRDGVLNEKRSGYVLSWADFRFLPGAVDAVRRLTLAGWPVIVVTNQSCVGRGMIDAPTLDRIHAMMCAEIAAGGGHITRIFCCPHRPADGCVCRKPAPGLLMQAASELGVDLGRSFYVGDQLSDIEAGRAAGCRSVLVRTCPSVAALWNASEHSRDEVTVANDLSSALDVILAVSAPVR